LRVREPADPSKVASPYVKMPPSRATSQYPPPLGVGAIPATGAFRASDPAEPWKAASP